MVSYWGAEGKGKLRKIHGKFIAFITLLESER